MVEQGFVSYLPEERRYGLGVVTFEMGSSYSRQMPLRRVAQPVLSRLASTTRENAHLAVLHGPDVYYVIEQRAPRRRALVSDVGVRLPATVTASGLAILGALSAAQVRAIFPSSDALVERAGHGPTTLRDLRALLAAVRERGYALEDGLVTAGLASVGVPVLDRTGYPVAGISVTFEADRVDRGSARSPGRRRPPGRGHPDPAAGRLAVTADSAGAAAPAESWAVSRRWSPAPGARSATARACPRRRPGRPHGCSPADW